MYHGNCAFFFLQLLSKLRIIQTGETCKDYGFTILWTIIGMIIPICNIVLSRDDIINVFASTNMNDFIKISWNFVFLQVNLILIVPAICITGKSNPDMMSKELFHKTLARPVFLFICLIEIFIGFVQSTIIFSEHISKTCFEINETCALNIFKILFSLQFSVYRSIAIFIISMSSGQITGHLEDQQFMSIPTITKLINMFKEVKSSVSTLLFVNLTNHILDCIIKIYLLSFVDGYKATIAVKVVIAVSFVVYYCLALDDCYTAYKNHIKSVR